MLSPAPRVDHQRMTVAQLISDVAVEGRAPMPIDAPPVGSVHARRRRLAALRESLAQAGPLVDIDAVAQAITRRAMFDGELRRQLAENG
jgi:methylaspartate ammonia-lyase